MIIKFIGIILVMVSASLIGCGFAECMAARERELYNLCDAVSLIINELSYTLEPVKFLFAKSAPAAKGGAHEVFEKISEYISEGNSASEAWCRAIDDFSVPLCFTKSDSDFLKNCSDLFSAHEAQQQKIQLENLQSKIHILAERAGEKRRKNSKLARMLGVYGGVLLCAVLF